MTGRTIGHYKLLDKLGQGGMGEVWKAEDTQLRRTVALKFLSSETIGDEEVKARLIREAQASASLDHPNICHVYGIHEENGETFIAMAYIDGPSLADKIKERPLPLDQALDIAIQIADGMQEAHEKGIVHRDIKPHNSMLTAKGQVKIMDFGLAHVAGRSKLTKTGRTLGTPAYMSPEQLEGREVDRRADIWSLGVVLYEMLAGRTPFDADYEQAIAYGILNEQPEPVTALRSSLPVEIDRVVSKALAKDPAERYQHADELVVDLKKLRRDSSRERAPVSVPISESSEKLDGPKVVRFGVFEVDFATRELRKRGVRVKLQDQPFRILDALLEKPGQIVTREELKERLWADDEFVEFDKSLNTSVQKIRQALGDSAESPRFVETVPRVGYRLISPVERVGEVRSRADQEPLMAEAAAILAAQAEPVGQRMSPRTVTLLAVAVVALLGVSVGVTWWLTLPPPQSPPPVLQQLTFDTGLSYQPAISPDGKLVAYASDRAAEGNLDIWLKPVAGGEPTRLTRHQANDDEPAFSPDGGRIAFHSERDGGGIYVMPLLGGDATLIAGNARRPRFSPDGRWIAYMSFGSGYSIWVVPASGGEPRQVRHRSLVESRLTSRPVWGPDSKHLLFAALASLTDVDWWFASIDDGTAVKTGAVEVFRRHGLLGVGSWRNVMPRTSAWLPGEDRAVFPAAYGDSTNLWSIPISPRSGQVSGDPRRLTMGPGPHLDASAAADGRLVFAGETETIDLWTLPVDANGGKVSGQLEPLTRDTAADRRPMLSGNGEKLVFTSDRSGNVDVWTRDMETGKETALTVTPGDESEEALITADGSTVAYRAAGGQRQVAYVVSSRGGAPRKICDDCGTLHHWSPDEKKILCLVGPGRIGFLDLESGKKTLLLQHPEYLVYNSRFSPDGQWITFHAIVGVDVRRVFVVPFRGAVAIPPEDWIAVTDGSTNDYDPWWSPDGNLLYFVSESDGGVRIRAQRLEPETKQPVGSLEEVYHFAEAGLSVADRSTFKLSVAGGRLVLNLTETTGNIWMMEPVAGE